MWSSSSFPFLLGRVVPPPHGYQFSLGFGTLDWTGYGSPEIHPVSLRKLIDWSLEVNLLLAEDNFCNYQTHYSTFLASARLVPPNAHTFSNDCPLTTLASREPDYFTFHSRKHSTRSFHSSKLSDSD